MRGPLQEPLLFAGDLCFNLDPTEECAVFGSMNREETLWAVLEPLGLGPFLRSRGGLSMSVEAGGANLSTGQRQLLATARAILRRPGFLVLDEATANVDEQTERAIMAALREVASGVTTLAIAYQTSLRECESVDSSFTASLAGISG